MKNYVMVLASCMGLCSLLFLLSGCGQANEKRLPQLFEVEIAQMQFKPAEVTVMKGDTIRFVNHDMVPHDITEQTAKTWSSGPLQPQQSWMHVANQSDDYYCSLHQVMKGKILIE
jgi:plastocyanin